MIGLPVQPGDRRGDEVEPLQEVVHVAVGRQQVLPRQHPHQVADPERRDQQDQEQRLALPPVPRHVVRDRVADQQAEELAMATYSNVRIKVGCKNAALPKNRLSDLSERARSSTTRAATPAPACGRWIDRAEGHRDDRVERQDEEEDQPDVAGHRERGPVPPRVPGAAPRCESRACRSCAGAAWARRSATSHPALNSSQASCHLSSPRARARAGRSPHRTSLRRRRTASAEASRARPSSGDQLLSGSIVWRRLVAVPGEVLEPC